MQIVRTRIYSIEWFSFFLFFSLCCFRSLSPEPVCKSWTKRCSKKLLIEDEEFSAPHSCTSATPASNRTAQMWLAGFVSDSGNSWWLFKRCLTDCRSGRRQKRETNRPHDPLRSFTQLLFCDNCDVFTHRYKGFSKFRIWDFLHFLIIVWLGFVF